MTSKYTPPFSITNEIVELVGSISESLGSFHSISNLERFPRLRKQNRIRSIASSCAIEANSLLLGEVKDIIDGKTVIGPQKDILEIKDAKLAYDQIEKVNPYSVKDLLSEHALMTKGLVKQPGCFRTGEEGVFDGDKCIFMAPPAKLVSGQIDDLFSCMKENKDKINPLILSSVFHYEFVFIHPFPDGNGRMARLWQTALLGKYRPLFYWIPLESFIKDNQKGYYDALSSCHKNGESTLFILFMLRMISKAISSIKGDIDSQKADQDSYTNLLLAFMAIGKPYTMNELLAGLGLRSKDSFRKLYLKPAMKAGLIEYERKDKPTSRFQRYIKIKRR